MTAKAMAKVMLAGHEGKRKKVYRCPAGKLTIGVGRNLEDTGLRDCEIEFMLDNDVDEANGALQSLFGTDVVYSWTTEQRAALIDMHVQLGYYRFGSFKRMIQAIREDNWSAAAQEALDSKWAQIDVPERAVEIADLLRTYKENE
jgi:lysozyme